MKRTLLSLLALASIAGAAQAQTPGGTYQPGYGGGQPQAGYGQPAYGQPGMPAGGFGQQPGASLQSLSGPWFYSYNGRDDQSPMHAQVDASGNLMVQAPGMTLRGRFQDLMAQGQVVSVGAGGKGTVTSNVVLQFDGQCHIQVRMFAANGKSLGEGMFHVNHRPGAPCAH